MIETTAPGEVMKVRTSEGPKLGFPTGIPPRRFRNADTVAIRKAPGFTVNRTGRTAPWPMEELIEIEGEMVALGPWIAGTQPLTAGDVDPELVRLLVVAARTLGTAGFPLGGFYQRAFRRTPDGGLLVFPPVLAAWIRESAPGDTLEQEWERWTHPDLADQEAWSHSLGVLVWTAVTGADPFGEEGGEERRERIRRGLIPPPELYVPGIDPGWSDLVVASLGGLGGKRPTLEDWEDGAEGWIEEGMIPPESGALSDQEAEVIRESARRKNRVLEKRLRARRWLRRSGWRFLSLTGAAALALGFLSAPVRRALETPLTAGMTPMEVAETYYSAMSALDAETMDDSLHRGVGKTDKRQVDIIYVTHRVRQGYEGLPDLPSAAQWLADGQPDLPPGLWPWGVTDLELRALPDGRIEARYRLWTPGESEPENFEVTPRTDLLEFREFRRSWRITEIQRVESVSVRG